MSEKKQIHREEQNGDGKRNLTLPLLILRGLVAFPGIPMNLELTDEMDVVVCRAAEVDEGYVFLLSQKSIEEEHPTSPEDFCRIGTLAQIHRVISQDDRTRVQLEGICRGEVLGVSVEDQTVSVRCLPNIDLDGELPETVQKLMDEAKSYFSQFVKYLNAFSKELQKNISSLSSPGVLADHIAAAVLVNYQHKQEVLEKENPVQRLDTLCEILDEELSLLQEEMNIHKEVRRRLDENQKEFYLREQIRVIKEELGESEEDDETEEYIAKIKKAAFPADVESRLLKEVGKLAKTPYSSAESTVLRNYLDICLEIPFGRKTEGGTDLEKAEEILNRDHYGMEKVKERVLEFLAVRKLKPDVNGQILCLVGPPGVGKTSIAASLAEAMGRKYVRVSLGGVRDEADIRGHRKTYVASMPGRIVNALIQAESANPLILLDEIDKLANDQRGDPASALLEVLDGEQNKTFRDHFVEIPIDLSDCVFVATANTLETVSRPLIDRMEVIELPIYNRREKQEIAKGHLLPKQMKRHGLTKRQLKVDDDVLLEIADYYTTEAGVRNLEREISRLCRKSAKKLVDGSKSVKITLKNLKDFLGERKILPEHIYDTDPVGIVNGMAYNGVGGDLLRVEAVAMPGSGKLELTGSLGDVIKESAHIALTYIRLHAEALGIDPEFYKKKDIHIHFPEGATPKDGPSAGVAVATALASELSGRPVRRDLSMTGEITLHGRVLPIGGLKEKTMAAYKAGVTTILLPEGNRKDVEEDVDVTVKDHVTLRFCQTLEDVFDAAILPSATEDLSDSRLSKTLRPSGEEKRRRSGSRKEVRTKESYVSSSSRKETVRK